jgi:hypothetical protein
MPTPVSNHDKLSPTFHSTNSSGGSSPSARNQDFAPTTTAVETPAEMTYSQSSEYYLKPQSSDVYFTSRRRDSFHSQRLGHNVYAPATPPYAHHPYHHVEPYPRYQRPRAQSSPNGYPASETPYAGHSGSYSPYSPPPAYRAIPANYSQGTYSTPPTPQDRRKAHILSEQKRRESINGGFAELQQLLSSDALSRALSVSCRSPIDSENTKLVFDMNSFLGGERRQSKATLLQKAVKAIERLSEFVMDLESENALLAKNLKHTKRASTETIVTIVEEIELSDDKSEELKKEVRCS